jgi:hypothetical protein
MAGSVGPVAQALAGSYQGAASALGAAGGVVTGALAVGVRSCLGIGAMFGKGAANWGILRAAGCRLRFPDGMVGNRILEIKGPFDKPRPGQLEDYKTLSGADPMVADAESCGAAETAKKCPRRV